MKGASPSQAQDLVSQSRKDGSEIRVSFNSPPRSLPLAGRDGSQGGICHHQGNNDTVNSLYYSHMITHLPMVQCMVLHCVYIPDIPALEVLRECIVLLYTWNNSTPALQPINGEIFTVAAAILTMS